MKVAWVYHPFFLKHDTGEGHPECPARLEVIVEALESAGLIDRMEPIAFDPATDEMLSLVHEPAYVKLVDLACDEGMTFIGTRDTNITRESSDAARLAAGGVLAACDAVTQDWTTRAFCAVRPPGHHAERDQAMGYCLFNNVALAAAYLIEEYAYSRVAIVDWDVHHGNGTQHIFEDRRDVLYISLHQNPAFCWPGSGYEHEQGTGEGMGFTMNIPMKAGDGDAAYHEAFEATVLPRLDAFEPQFVLISAGFDGAKQDRTSDINLTPAGFAWMTAALRDVADRHARGHVVSVLEGGYDLPTLGACVTSHVEALL